MNSHRQFAIFVISLTCWVNSVK